MDWVILAAFANPCDPSLAMSEINSSESRPYSSKWGLSC